MYRCGKSLTPAPTKEDGSQPLMKGDNSWSNSVIIYSKVLPNAGARLTKLELLINILFLKELWPTDTWQGLASLRPACVTSAHCKGNKEPDCLLTANGGGAMSLPGFYLPVHQALDKGSVQPTGQLPKRSKRKGTDFQTEKHRSSTWHSETFVS